MTVPATVSGEVDLAASADRVRARFGAAPVSYYDALPHTGTGARSYREYVRAAASASDAGRAAESEGGLLAIGSRVPAPARRQELPEPRRSLAPGALDRQLGAALEGVRAWRLAERSEARRRARAAAERVADLDFADAGSERADRQHRLDAVWKRLIANDPAVVLPTVEDALAQQRLPAVALDVRGATLTLGLVVDTIESVVPERRPNVTPTGRHTLKKRTKTEVNEFYVDVLAALCAASVRTAASVAPAVDVVVVVACRAKAGSELECVYVGVFDATADIAASAARVLFDRSAMLFELGGRTAELRALDLAAEPGVAAVVERLAAARRGGGR